ncbi:hypothetical protein GOB87_07065 [Acetobacter estunensis]|uniref:Uncharacterized protein n=1 Tax=Acetobacter estunensis TaxID=104097 RepID=A0A967EIR7_9PROT|nr:hypothetical protein [Acetobacter estunensis]NHO53724.1 hypothetical protein [Acetobacter estunensis]
MTHTRPLYSGPIYNTFAKDKIDPHEEVRELMSAFENHPGSMEVYGGYLRNGRRVSAFETRMRNAIGLFAIAGNSKLPWNTFRMGCAMLVRAFTKMRYRPEQLRPLSGTKMAAFGMGVSSRDVEISLPIGNNVTQISPVIGQSFSEGASV